MPQKRYKTIKVKHLKTFGERSRGLIGRKKTFPVYFETRFGIHTFGMRQPIDVIILDRNHKVVKIKRGLEPNRLFFWNPKYFRVLELSTEMRLVRKLTIGKKVNIVDIQ